MKFQLTLNMPSREGRTVHQVIVEHPSANIDEFIGTLNRSPFFVGEEWYRDKDGGWYVAGNIGMNREVIGKVKPYRTE